MLVSSWFLSQSMISVIIKSEWWRCFHPAPEGLTHGYLSEPNVADNCHPNAALVTMTS